MAKIKEVSELDNQRRLRREREKRRIRNGWVCLIIYWPIILISAFYLGQSLNLFFQILLLILVLILLIIGYYLVHKFFFKRRTTRFAFDHRH